MRIFEHNFVADKAKIRRHAAAWQGFLTQYAAKFAEKTCAYAYEDRFLNSIDRYIMSLPLSNSLKGGGVNGKENRTVAYILCLSCPYRLHRQHCSYFST